MKSEKLLLVEYNGLDTKKDIQIKGNDVFLSGVIQRANARNGNGRIYPLEVLKKSVQKYAKLVEENRGAGEADHPPTVEVSLKNISHIITDVWWQGNDVYGRLKLTNNSVGRDVKQLIEDGLKMGISSRGYGSVTKKGDDVLVNDDFELVCFDLVHDPSTAGAYVLKEGKYIKVDESRLFNDNSPIIIENKSYNKIESILEKILSTSKV